jgi:hypothetical protein
MNEEQHKPENSPFFLVDRNNLQNESYCLDSFAGTG